MTRGLHLRPGEFAFPNGRWDGRVLGLLKLARGSPNQGSSFPERGGGCGSRSVWSACWAETIGLVPGHEQQTGQESGVGCTEQGQ